MRARSLGLALALASALGCGESKRLETNEEACGPLTSSEWDPPGLECFPGMPCACEVRVAPSAACMTPSPTWIERSDGVLELDAVLLPASSRGDSYQGRQLLSFGRDLGQIDGEHGVIEWTVLDLASGEIVFQARDRETIGAPDPCGLFIAELGQGNVVHGAIAAEPREWALAGGPVPAGVPDLIHNGTGEDFPYAVFVGRDVIGAAFNREAMVDPRIMGIPLDADRPAPLLIDETGGLAPLGAWDGTVFLEDSGFVGTTDVWHGSLWVWDVDGGLQPLLASGDGVSEVCGLGTDGETLVWTEYSGWNGSEWASIDLMQAPFTTQADELLPARVRSLGSGMHRGCSPWRVGGGHVVGGLVPLVTGAPVGLVVRLSDGQAFPLPEPLSGAWYAAALYITDDELAIPLTTQTAERIVRLPLELLGPGVPPSEPL